MLLLLTQLEHDKAAVAGFGIISALSDHIRMINCQGSQEQAEHAKGGQRVGRHRICDSLRKRFGFKLKEYLALITGIGLERQQSKARIHAARAPKAPARAPNPPVFTFRNCAANTFVV